MSTTKKTVKTPANNSTQVFSSFKFKGNNTPTEIRMTKASKILANVNKKKMTDSMLNDPSEPINYKNQPN